MATIAMCVALVVLGVAAVVRWGGAVPPERRAEHPPRNRAARLLRYVGGALAAGLIAGVLAAGAGGRLVMRLLALTSPEAEGLITEADEIVGEISLEGTLALILFGGIPAGLLSGALYALVRPILPAGRAGGVLFGLGLLILAGTRLEPMRADNPDFVIVGPAWLAVLAFTALALFHGMLVVALGERISPAPSPGPRDVRRLRAATTGRIAAAVLLLVALPGFVAALVDILESG